MDFRDLSSRIQLKDASAAVRQWLINLFVSAVNNASKPEDRLAAVEWLAKSRDILANNEPSRHKIKQLTAIIDGRAAARMIAGSVSHSVTNYKNANLPWSIKLAIPVTLAAAPVLGGQAVGIAAFGSAIGAPALLLLFLGAAGVTSIIEGVLKSPGDRSHIALIISQILEGEELRRINARMKAAMREQPQDATIFPMPPEEHALRATLLTMDPYEFERHVMGFFQALGFMAWVTRKSNDYGVDGFARHPNGLLVTQCKRNAPENKVGGPVIRQFKGALEESGAFRGYVITTSSFTPDAVASAAMSDKIRLIDMDELVRWHSEAPNVE